MTVEEKAFDAAFFKPDTKLNTSYPIVIEMDNGQKVTSGVSVKLFEDAAVTSENNRIVIYEVSVTLPSIFSPFLRVIITGCALSRVFTASS